MSRTKNVADRFVIIWRNSAVMKLVEKCSNTGSVMHKMWQHRFSYA
jgi:hypothetical protein